MKDRSQGDNFQTIIKNNWHYSKAYQKSTFIKKSVEITKRTLKSKLTESFNSFKKPSPNETSQDPYLDTKPFALIPIRHALIAPD